MRRPQPLNSQARTAAWALAALAAVVAVGTARADSTPSLALNASHVPSTARTGDWLTYRLVAENRSQESATGVLLTGTVRGPASLVSAHTDRGDCSVLVGTVTCALGTLEPGASAKATVVARTSGPGSAKASFVTKASTGGASNTVLRRTAVRQQARSVRLPAAGPLLWPALAARSAPRAHARVVRVFRQLRPDLLPQIVLATGARTDAYGRLWYRVEIPMRPNGRLGWVRADGVDQQTVHRSIVIQRGLRRLTVLAGRRVLLRTRVAVGARGMETPLGRF